MTDLLFHTQSTFTSTLGMLHVFISFFVAYAIHKSCISEWFPFLLFVGLFVICGVGADDIFVFVDAFRQSGVLLPPDTTLDRRISWAYRRASTAMLITSLTTAMAFASNWINSVLPVCLFGEFMVRCIYLNVTGLQDWSMR